MLSLFLMAVSLIVSPFSALIVLFCFVNWSSNMPLFPQNLTIGPYPSNREMHLPRSGRKLSYEQTGFLHHFPLVRQPGNREYNLATVNANGGILFTSFDQATHTNYGMKKINLLPLKTCDGG